MKHFINPSPSNSIIIVILLLFLIGNGCKKVELNENIAPDNLPLFSSGSSGEFVQTIIGAARDNPYTVSNMQAAYLDLYNSLPVEIQPTHYYIRFAPTDADEIRLLDTMDINFYDFPLHHEIIEMGDYYIDPNRSLEDPPFLYAILPVGSNSPLLNYAILDTLHLYSEDESLIRRALELKGYDPDEEGYAVGRHVKVEPPDETGGGGGGGGSGSSGPLIKDQDCSCKSGLHIRNPAGCVSVYDTQLSTSGNCSTYKGVAYVKVILKDSWFTEHEVWTNRYGCFRLPNVKYSNNVWQWIKFIHPSRGHVRGVRNGWVSIWDWMFIIKKNVGKKKLVNFNHLDVCLNTNTNQNSKDRHYWNAATVFNGLHEYTDFATRNGLGYPPNKLDMYIDRNDGGGAAYMFDKMTDKGPIWNNVLLGGNISLNLCLGDHGWGMFLCRFIELLFPLTSVIVSFMPDIVVGCGNLSTGAVRPSDRIKNTTYHELGHAAHYQKLPPINRNIWWIDNVSYIVHIGSFSNPYGDGTHVGAPKCAVVEMWGYHIGHTIADAAYGLQSSPAILQPGPWKINTSGRSSHWWVLEDYDPNLSSDPSSWMPLGVLHDLMDDRVESNNEPVIDNVSGYTQQKFFNALQSDVISIPLYKARLLQQNNNNQQSNVDILFQSYNY